MRRKALSIFKDTWPQRSCGQSMSEVSIFAAKFHFWGTVFKLDKKSGKPFSSPDSCFLRKNLSKCAQILFHGYDPLFLKIISFILSDRIWRTKSSLSHQTSGTLRHNGKPSERRLNYGVMQLTCELTKTDTLMTKTLIFISVLRPHTTMMPIRLMGQEELWRMHSILITTWVSDKAFSIPNPSLSWACAKAQTNKIQTWLSVR